MVNVQVHVFWIGLPGIFFKGGLLNWEASILLSFPFLCFLAQI